MNYFYYYLKKKKFTVHTDHKALTWARTKESFSNLKLERMRENPQEYNFTIKYIPGKEMTYANALSRLKEILDNYTKKEKRSKNFFKSEDEISY